ncbi:Xaa-Pro aminopeptidase ApepP [Eumeta japonica]|uniref:Xaa-Pro aminopeptidase ApepP n=1 Tax=Eumeta variegata TaxID=151549 RepID=A0A4C1XYM0_EUMVA|nr:Xaa-Pro aminopeptidase ApepP [Eumeta japonica]
MCPQLRPAQGFMKKMFTTTLHLEGVFFVFDMRRLCARQRGEIEWRMRLIARRNVTRAKTLSDANIKLQAISKNLIDEARVELNDPPPPRKFNMPYTLPVKYTGCVKRLALPWRGYESTVALNVQRSWEGGIKKDSESECVALKRMRVVYLLQASASVSNEQRKTSGQKVSELRKKMKKKKASILVLTALDDIAYTLNLRGTDIKYNPVFFSYLVIDENAVILFWSDGVLPQVLVEHFKNEGLGLVTSKPYEEIFDYLQKTAVQLLAEGDGTRSIWLSHDASEAIHIAASGGSDAEKQMHLISEVSPVAVAKVVKNDVELQGMRDCHVRDGVALIRFFRWLHQYIDNGGAVTEIEAADKLEEFRKIVLVDENALPSFRLGGIALSTTEPFNVTLRLNMSRDEADYMGPSFETIPGAGENGAIIHYSPEKNGPQKKIERGEMFLLDSGGQYRDGTTDVTRTRHMGGRPTDEQKAAFTRVLIGQINMGNAVFPKGVKGNVLDSLARKALWDVGLDYAHGTGHGVGHHLNVHEGPSGISWRTYPDDPGLQPAMIFSNGRHLKGITSPLPDFYEEIGYLVEDEDADDTLGANLPPYPKVARWCAESKRERTTNEDDLRPGRPTTASDRRYGKRSRKKLF